MVKIPEMSYGEFLALLREMEQEPSGYSRIDLEAVLLRANFGRHPHAGFDLYLHDGCAPVHLRTTQDDVPRSVVQRIARDVLAVLREG